MKQLFIILICLLISGCVSSNNYTTIDHGQLKGYKTIEYNQLPINAQIDISFQIIHDNYVKLDSLITNSSIILKNLNIKISDSRIHFNLNQPAKQVDSNSTDWTIIVNVNDSIIDNDVVYFCGPVSTFTVQILDIQNNLLLFDDSVNGVNPC